MRRLFTFGCSFTEYAWPTWADILSKDYDFFLNYGKSGAGNMYISAAVAEASIANNFNKDDTVAVMWTNCTREDRYLNNGWQSYGNIYTAKKPYELSEDWITKYITPRGCYVRDFANIHLTKKLLDSIGCKYIMFKMVDFESWDQYTNAKTENIKDILEHYKETILAVKLSVHKTVFNYNWYCKNPWKIIGADQRPDAHPTPKEHLEYLKLVLDYQPSGAVNDWVEKIDKEVIALFPKGNISKAP